MVVAQIVHITNNTLRTFQVVAGDPFYTPRVDGKPCVDGTIEVPPGFDQAADGFVVPWEILSRTGLEISAVDSGQLLRCVVGAVESDVDNRDWLQFRSATLEPISPDKWMALGRRHTLGTIGAAVEIRLTFRDARGQPSSSDGPEELAEVIHFEQASRCAAQNTVFLNVFDLAPALSVPNAMLCNTVFTTVGAFHAAVEVYGEEWSFYRTPSPTSCGVCKSLRPRHHPVHVYRQSVSLGPTTLRDWEVRYLIRGKLASKWPGGGYDLLHRNCIHFCDELQLSLGVKPVPPWVRGLHETGATVLRTPWPLSLLFNGEPGTGRFRPLTDDERDRRGVDGEENIPDNASTGAASEAATVASTAATRKSAPTTGPGERYDPYRAPCDGTFVDPDGKESPRDPGPARSTGRPSTRSGVIGGHGRQMVASGRV